MAIYCRVSTSDRDNDRRERDLRAYAERAGYEVVAVSRGTLSGIRRTKGKQPTERKRAMALARSREIDAVLVTELTRSAGTALAAGSATTMASDLPGPRRSRRLGRPTPETRKPPDRRKRARPAP